MSIENKNQNLFDNIKDTSEDESNEKQLINKVDLSEEQEIFDNIQSSNKNRNESIEILLICVQIIEIILEYVGVVNYQMEGDSDMKPIIFISCYPTSILLLLNMVYRLPSDSRYNHIFSFAIGLLICISILFFLQYSYLLLEIVFIFNVIFNGILFFIINCLIPSSSCYTNSFILKSINLFFMLYILCKSDFTIFVMDSIVNIIIFILTLHNVDNNNNNNNNNKKYN